MNRLVALLFAFTAVGCAARAQSTPPATVGEFQKRESLLRAALQAYFGDSLGRHIHWADNRDSVLARFSTCRPYKSDVACVLNDTVPTYSIESTIVRDSATVVVSRFYMVYERCPLRIKLDPPRIGWDTKTEVWVFETGKWQRTGTIRGMVC